MKSVLFLISLVYLVYGDKPTKIINLLAPSNLASEPFLVEPTNISSFDRYITRLSKGRQPSVEDAVKSPIFVIATDSNDRNHLIYLRRGLKSIPGSLKTPALRTIEEYLNPRGIKYGLVFRPATSNDQELLGITIHEALIPKNFKVGDVFRILAGSRQTPFMYLVDISVIDGLMLKYKSLGEVGMFENGKKIRIIKQ